ADCEVRFRQYRRGGLVEPNFDVAKGRRPDLKVENATEKIGASSYLIGRFSDYGHAGLDAGKRAWLVLVASAMAQFGKERFFRLRHLDVLLSGLGHPSSFIRLSAVIAIRDTRISVNGRTRKRNRSNDLNLGIVGGGHGSVL